MKLTPWFSGTVKPVRFGVYERQYSLMRSERLYCYWNGIRWSPVATSIQEAKELKPFASAGQDLPWRGVLK